MRVTTAFSRLLCLTGVWVRKVCFKPDRVVVEVALKRRRLHCPLCEYSTWARKDKRPVDSVWRHLDLGICVHGPGSGGFALDGRPSAVTA